MATHNPEFLKQIAEVSRPIWEGLLKENNLSPEEAEIALDMSFEDFCQEVRLELTA